MAYTALLTQFTNAHKTVQPPALEVWQRHARGIRCGHVLSSSCTNFSEYSTFPVPILDISSCLWYYISTGNVVRQDSMRSQTCGTHCGHCGQWQVTWYVRGVRSSRHARWPRDWMSSLCAVSACCHATHGRAEERYQ